MTGKIKLVHSGGNSVSVAVPTNAPSASEVEFKLPQADGTSGQALVTDASGNLSFAGTGKILQVVQTVKLDTFSTTSTTNVDVTGLSVAITPASSSNKVLVTVSIGLSGNQSTNYTYAILKRGNTQIGEANEASNRIRPTLVAINENEGETAHRTFTFLDSPNTTSATTYKIQIRCSSAGNAHVNRSHRDLDQTGIDARTSSTITVMEVAA